MAWEPYAPVVILALILLHGVVTCLRRARRARRRGDSYRDELTAAAELRAGDVIASGRVAYAQDARQAMRVDIEQVGTESESSGSWSHSWTETSRKLTVQPFYLVQGRAPDERRIRVEPLQASQLFDALDKKILVSTGEAVGTQWKRLCAATLVPEERIWVVGRLARDTDPEAQPQMAGYRESGRGEGWVLRGAPTLLVSSVPLVEHFRGRAAMHRRQALLCAVLLVFPAYFVAARLDRVHGESVVGTITAVSRQTDDDDHVTGYDATVDVRGARWTSESLVSEPTVGGRFPLRIGGWSSNDGADVHWTVAECIALFVGFFAAFGVRISLRYYSRRQLPWFRSTKPYVESGSGRLTKENVTA